MPRTPDAEPDFRERVEILVKLIPPGRVMTYGQLAALCGNPRAARIVGGIAHFGNPSLPWQRVVSKLGGLASGYPGGRSQHKLVLESEGILVSNDYYVDVKELLWWPPSGRIYRDIMKNPTSPLIAIVGQTASGKSELAIKLAEHFQGEIICADSMTIYKGFNIGAAKPSQQERLKIPHHLIDVADPGSSYTTQTFQSQANSSIQSISRLGKLPILVGGSGLYIDSVLFDYKFLTQPSADLRLKLNRMNLTELLKKAVSLYLDTSSIDVKNKRRLIRLIETRGLKPTKEPIRPDTVVIGIRLTQAELAVRIKRRVDAMIENGLEDEVQNLARKYGWEIEQMKAVGYREWREYFEGKLTYSELVNRIIKDTLALTKKQNTWFKRNKSIHWFSNGYKFEHVVELVTTVLNK